ncbi:MAG: response regulator transcription factor [Gammaproteobacteria bacterium]|nr:response regulator transcription factor [Gammaproteobacteria bacterium]
MEPIETPLEEPIWPEYASKRAGRTRLLLIDDHAIVRAGLAALLVLESDLQIVGEAGSLEEALPLAAELEPDLVLCDLTMPGCSGCDAVRQLHRRFPRLKVMVLSAHCSLELVRDSFEAGACGYVRKDAFRADLLSALRRVASGSYATCSSVGEMVVRDWLKEPAAVVPEPRLIELDAEEERVLRMIALGVPTRRIAADLGRGVKAVEKFRMTLMRRLNLRSTAAIARFAVESKLLSFQDVDRMVAAD